MMEDQINLDPCKHNDHFPSSLRRGGLTLTDRHRSHGNEAVHPRVTKSDQD